jgi:hypothetical protein
VPEAAGRDLQSIRDNPERRWRVFAQCGIFEWRGFDHAQNLAGNSARLCCNPAMKIGVM